ncbi:toprim domain-containing protein [Aureimonas sp. SK2]|uniref:DUF7146 domain-containing protein n=1 Tax=Aureimonas sp. SK2 TaxID=3015992 RepID=UPI002443D868|nr:toprim domain-containing protein [Aureimonas sp. SK2]
MLALAKARMGLSFPDALRFCGDIAGIHFDEPAAPDIAVSSLIEQSRRNQEARRREAARIEAEDLAERIGDGERIWNEARPIAGTLAETHIIEHRRLSLLGVNDGWCRFHPAPTYRKDGQEKRLGPAMVCLIRDVLTSAPCGIRLTILDDKGLKAFRLVIGRLKMGAVMIDDSAEVDTSLAVAEGVETALRLRQAGERPIWAMCSASNLAGLPVLPSVEALRIYADADRTDDRGRTPGIDAARGCALNWQAQDREVHVFTPPDAGTDWDDVLGSEVAA